MGSTWRIEEEKVTVFTHTNLGTHFAMSISSDITVPDFKREVESNHLSCFPQVGAIRVNSVMVKRKSRLYHLSESFPLKYAFLDCTRAYFFYIEACQCHHINSDNVGLSQRVSEKEPQTRVVSSITNTNCKRKKRRLKGLHCLRNVFQEFLRAGRLSNKRKKKRRCLQNNFVQNYPIHGFESKRERDWDFSQLDETYSDTSSGSVSVSGIIKKYFSNSDELTSSSEVNFAGIRTWPEERLKFRTDDNCSGQKNNIPPEFSATTPPEMMIFPLASHSSSKTSSGVGKRLLIASNNLRNSQSKQKPAISLCSRYVPKSSFVRTLGGVLFVFCIFSFEFSFCFEFSVLDDFEIF